MRIETELLLYSIQKCYDPIDEEIQHKCYVDED